MITNMMIKTPQDTPGKLSRKVSQSHFLMAMDSSASAFSRPDLAAHAEDQ
jgi:hypothetical protein